MTLRYENGELALAETRGLMMQLRRQSEVER